MSNTLIQVSENVRIERGPMPKRAKATTELLDNKVTAKHYQVGKRDRLGNIIFKNKEMDYLDWKGEWCWYVYQWQYIRTAMLRKETRPEDGKEVFKEVFSEDEADRDEDGNVLTKEVWCYVEVDRQPKKEWALEAANKLGDEA